MPAVAIRHNRSMGNPLIDLVVAIVALCGAIAIIGMLRTGSLYQRIGQDGESSMAKARPEPAPGSTAAAAERDIEIRQMLLARSERLVRRGEPPLDLDAEVRLIAESTVTRGASVAGEPSAAEAHSHDPELVEELRQLAEARNQRRMRRGEPPLDVRAEVARALAELEI